MSRQNDTMQQPLIKGEYQRVSSSRKLNLLLQRSVRYSYRQRCCNCCPTILCELLFPIIIIGLLGLGRYGINKLDMEMKKNNDTSPGPMNQRPCSQALNTLPVSSNDLFVTCFKFPPRFGDRDWNTHNPDPISNRTNFAFEPDRPDIKELGQLAEQRLRAMNCAQTTVMVQDPDSEADTLLLRNTTINTVIIDFAATKDLKTERNLAYSIMVRTPNALLMSDPIDTSFISYKHPSIVGDRTNATNHAGKEGSQLPEFTDVKMFIDLILMECQTTREIKYELQRNLMACTPYRDDSLFTSGANFVGTILILVDALFIIPYLILLSSLIREKNAKVKEILKVLGIEPILNNFAQALRTMIIYTILVVLLCIVYKLNLNPYAYFDTVNYGTLLLGNFIYALQLTSFCIMNAQLFDKNVRAIIFTFALYFVSNSLFSWAILWPPGVQYLLMFICPFIAGRSLFQQAILYDLANKDVALFATVYRHVPMYFPTLIVLLISGIFYWALSWYFEKVFPGEFGVPQDWNFLFKRDYWRSESTTNKNDVFAYDNRASEVSRPNTPLARRNSTGSPVVHVDRLVKKFGPDKIAVNEVSFDLYENQITSLLGPNGSGKTTIFNCLIGIYKQTSGTITMANEYGVDYDTRHNMDVLRKSIGYCPQHDILFDLLTVEEQIEFYATARGFGKNKQQISKEMLRLVNLENSKDVYCNSLSGGMKRRLSLACAFVGDTKIILLDEPSSGLDPSNRRLLWDWLRTMKEGKTLLLTTHFMEESDALSDRIMIISNGNIKADGTSAKLKEDYGSGYKLVVNKQANGQTKQIEDELRNYIPNINVESDIPGGGDVVFRTNQQPDEQFVQALRQLEGMKSKDIIKNYGVQNSTMDDVFLKITRDTTNENDPQSTSVNLEHIDQQCRQVFNDAEFFSGINYYLSQLYGLLMKTLLVRYRRWGLTIIVLLLPIIYNILSNVISETQNATGTFKMDVDLLSPQKILYAVDPTMENYFQSAVGYKKNDVTLEKRSENITQINQYIKQQRMDRPYTYTDIYLGFHISSLENDSYKVETISSNLISGYEIASVASDTIYKLALDNIDASIKTTLIYKQTGNFTIQPTLGGILNLLSIASCFLKILPTSLILDVFIFYLIFLYTAIFLSGERKDSFLSLLNISGLHPAFYWIFNYIFDIITSVFWFCYILAIYCLCDVAFNGTPSSRPKSTSSIPIEFASAWDLRVQFYPLSILIALPTLPFVYLLTKVFSSDILCGLLVLFLLIIIHLVSIIVPIIMAVVNNDLALQIVYWILNIISPSINAQAIITYMLAQKSEFCKVSGAFFDIFPRVGDNTMGINWIILILQIIILLSLLISIDMGLLKFSSLFGSKNILPVNENVLDNDVVTERHRVLNIKSFNIAGNHVNTDNNQELYESDHLTVHDLVKRYRRRNVFAVNHLTFGAKRGEAFGLLGYNGAGKTSTFRILVGDETATHGTAFIDGQNISHRFRSIRRLGYCPQDNCSMDFLTVRDGLYLLARVRGVNTSRIHTVVETISSLFLLDPFLNNYIHQLSGGTKRRLHAALALIGPPLVVILDEPTTGVDPTARQQMQEIFLNAVKAGLTIILTSHSMDECERVCNRLGIMYNGQLACLGTIQHLKSKFGQGYTIEIKVRTVPGDTTGATIENVRAFLASQNQFTVEVREQSFSTGSFQIRQSTPADLFQLLEQNKQQLHIETYTITQTTLEQIFLSFGKQINATV